MIFLISGWEFVDGPFENFVKSMEAIFLDKVIVHEGDHLGDDEDVESIE